MILTGTASARGMFSGQRGGDGVSASSSFGFVLGWGVSGLEGAHECSGRKVEGGSWRVRGPVSAGCGFLSA